MAGLTQKYRHSSGFAEATVAAGIPLILAKYSPGTHSMSVTNCVGLIRQLGADARVSDIRYIAYMLATATKEARELREFPRPAPPAPKGKAANAKPLKPQKQWVVYDPINENWKGLTTKYLEPVKVARLPDGALITEIDGDQFWVNLGGDPHTAQKKSADTKKFGAVYGDAHSKTYTDAAGDVLHYRGRGLVQLTWWYNYAKNGVRLGRGLELLFNPELALQPDIAYELMVRGMLGGWYKNGETCERYFTDSKTDYYDARNIINPGDKKHRQEIADIALAFETLLMSARAGVAAAKP
jgi:hypothetical protein